MGPGDEAPDLRLDVRRQDETAGDDHLSGRERVSPPLEGPVDSPREADARRGDRLETGRLPRPVHGAEDAEELLAHGGGRLGRGPGGGGGGGRGGGGGGG